MKKYKLNYVIALCMVFIYYSSATILAQSVGINTLAPTGTLDILSQGNSNLTKNLLISNSDNKNLLILSDNGNMGIGTATPSVRLDLRGDTGMNNIIGIGTTNLTAAAAQAGALKYVPDPKELHYSDGSQWMALEADVVRDCVIAENSYNLVECPNDKTTRLGNWIIKYDPTGTFNATSGLFTAPKTGLYTATFSIHFAATAININAGSYLEGQWVASNGKTIKCTNSFPEEGRFMAAIICSGTILLKAGDTLYPQVYHNIGTDARLRVTGSANTSDMYFNNLSIVMQ